MSARNGTTQRSLPLRDWISHFSRLEERLKHCNENGRGLDNPSASAAVSSEKEARFDYARLATAVAFHLVDRLMHNGEGSEDHLQGNILESSNAGLQHECIQAEDILAENFVVEISNDNYEQSVLGNIAKVDFVSSLQNKRRVKFDERIPDPYLRGLGHLFYDLFSPGSKSLQPGLENAKSQTSAEVTSDSEHDTALTGPNQLGDEDEPGSEKGRRKCSITETRKMFRKVGLSDVENLLQQNHVPISICRLVADLVHADETFECLNDVSLELDDILDDPDFFLGNEDAVQASLHFRQDNLYGRDTELTSLVRVAALVHMDALEQVEDRSHFNDIILIEGEPGTGKSHLVRRVEQTIDEYGWSFLRCKFDRLAQNQPLSIISSAFENFFHHIATLQSEVRDGVHGYSEDDIEEEEFRNTLLSSVQSRLSASGIVFLSELIPSFRTLYPDIFRMVVMDDDGVSDESDDGNDECKTDNTQNPDELTVNDGGDDDDACINGNTYRNRLHYLYRTLICAMSRPDRPVMFFLDDLQWADVASLNLLSSLVMDSHNNHQIGNAGENDSQRFLTVGSYRSNEVDTTHILSNYVDAFKNSNAVRVTNISLGGITRADTNAMISDVLKLPVRLTRALAHVVHTKTLGNPLFVKSFMTSLVDDKLLCYSLVKKRWVWKIENIQSISIEESVALIMTRKLLRMPQDVQYALTVASCFGVKSNEEVLLLLAGSDGSVSLVPSLQYAMQEGVLEKCGQFYAFPHDIIQQAVYDSIPSANIDDVHHNIGLKLLSSVPDFLQLNTITFMGISQINKIKDSSITDPSLHSAFATLNLKAGEQSIEVADFSSALSYIERGLLFLGIDGWESNYKLCLRLHESACLACYLNALPNRVLMFFDKIMKNTHTFEEKIKSHYILTRTLASTGSMEDAIHKAFQVLSELGEDFPSDITSSVHVSVLMSTNELLGNYSEEELLNFPKMIDERKLWAMKFLDVIFTYMYIVFPKKLPLVSCRMVTLSIQHGFCRETAFGLLSYGLSLMSILHDIDEGHRLSKMSLLVLKRFNAKALYPKLQVLHNSLIAFWVEPVQSTASELARCSEDALMAGDIEHASLSDAYYCIQSFMCGCQLDVLEKVYTRRTIEMVSGFYPCFGFFLFCSFS